MSSQGVEVCFLEIAPHTFLEFIEATQARSPIERFLSVGFYHLGFLIPDLSAAGRALKREGFIALPPFRSEAFDGNLCQFFLSPERHLIELAQMSAGDFESFFDARAGQTTGTA